MPEIEQQAAYYNRRWADLEAPNRYQLARLATILDYLSQLPDCTELCDLGCGTGWTSAVLGYLTRVHGVDLADVSETRRRFPHCDFETADILNWDYPRERFSVVVSQEVLEHIPYPRQVDYLRIAHGLLKPGGHLILTTPNKRTLDALPGGGRAWSDQPLEDSVGRSTLLQKLNQADFAVVHHTSIVLGPGHLGSYRLVNSVKLKQMLGKVGLGGLWRRTFLAAGYGLHLAVLARKH